MPEQGVLLLLEREAKWEEEQVPKDVSRDDDEAFYGHFVTHSECCAHVNGTRQTFTLHISSPSDPNFVPLPRPAPPKKAPKKYKEFSPFYCKCCHSTSPDEHNVAATSDELNLASLHLISLPPFLQQLLQFFPLHPCIVQIPQCTAVISFIIIIFVNQLAITGRLSAKARGKELVIAICNSTEEIIIAFGLEAHCFWILTQWYSEITSAPTICRGECSHAYALPDRYVQGPENPKQCISIQAAFIRPNWTLIFVDHNIMIQFHLIFGPPWGARAMDLFTTKSLQPHSLLSIPGILKFSPNPNTQTVFNGRGAQEATDLLILALIDPQMPTVYVCRDDITWARFRQAFIDYDKSRTDLVIKSNGHAEHPELGHHIPWHLQTTRILYAIQSPASQQLATVGADVREEVNKTPLGLYSFRILVNCAYSVKYIAKGKLPAGPHPVLSFGQSNRKQPLTAEIARTGAPKKKRIQIDKQENVPDLTQGIRTRSGRKLLPYFPTSAQIHVRRLYLDGILIGRTPEKKLVVLRGPDGILIGHTPKEKLVVLRGPGSEHVSKTAQIQLKPAPCAHRSLLHFKFGHGGLRVKARNPFDFVRQAKVWWVQKVWYPRHKLHLAPLFVIHRSKMSVSQWKG
ncbi:hypothetical protein B0H17DRAFT_1182162 [Mycena rosella]|uniref:Uncharacterized protein n=1 Tax=Mycena rosella TaxID=1033263 RepID=A0AAD7G995_MYCRO|nr:hypothetical protein B0H17DRAFT_1182162 [Mycena rosella]